YGHTVGHALESLAEGRLSHGECVLWGMRAESALLGRAGAEMVAMVDGVVEALGLEKPAEFARPARDWVRALGSDKKVAGGEIAMTILAKPGVARKLRISAKELAARIN
ncbi:MAG: hypothetical protein EOP11_17195, partial [Proteobacteria bacterium]